MHTLVLAAVLVVVAIQFTVSTSNGPPLEKKAPGARVSRPVKRPSEPSFASEASTRLAFKGAPFPIVAHSNVGAQSSSQRRRVMLESDPRIEVKGRGKSKLLNTSAQLDEYLSRKEPRQSGISTSGRQMDTLPYQPSTGQWSVSGTARQVQTHPSSKSTGKPRPTSSIRSRADTSPRLPDVNQAASSSSIRPRKTRGTRGFMEWERGKAFDRVWKELGLSIEMDPIALADGVIKMRLHGINSKSSTIEASKWVKAKGEPDYENKYMTRMKNLSKQLSKETIAVSKDSHLSTFSQEKQLQMALDETFKKVAAHQKRRRRINQSIKTAPLGLSKEVTRSIEQVGKLAQDHVESMGLNFCTMPLNKLEKVTRRLEMPGMTPSQFTRSLYRFIQHTRGETDENMEPIRRSRRRIGVQEYKRAKKEGAMRTRDES